MMIEAIHRFRIRDRETPFLRETRASGGMPQHTTVCNTKTACSSRVPRIQNDRTTKPTNAPKGGPDRVENEKDVANQTAKKKKKKIIIESNNNETTCKKPADQSTDWFSTFHGLHE